MTTNRVCRANLLGTGMLYLAFFIFWGALFPPVALGIFAIPFLLRRKNRKLRGTPRDYRGLATLLAVGAGYNRRVDY